MINEDIIMNEKKKSLEYMIQKFVYPLSDQNSIVLPKSDLIMVYWSAQFVKILKKTNYNSVYSDKVSLIDKMTTFDGSAKNCRTGRISIN